MALESSTLTRHAESDIFWDEVKTIELDGEEMTYDLSVPELENFIANDIVVHNSHAASYGKVAYQTAYMKANYPVEYMAALLTADAGDVERIAILVAECDRMKVKVLPPDINESRSTFTVVAKPASSEEAGRPSSESRFRGEQKDAIRFGLSSIKNFGEGISEAIITEREQSGPFQTLSDFLCRIGSKNLNKKSLESLIKCGALDSFGARGHLLAHIETLLTFHRDATAPQSQDTLFAATVPTLTLPPAKGEVSLIEKLDWERELLGIYVSGHPLDAHKDKTLKAHATLGSIREDPRPGLPLIVPVLISDVRAILTKNGEKMAFIKLEDKTGTMEAVVFPKLFKEHSTALVAGRCILVKGTVSKRNDELSLALDNIKAL